MKQTKFSADWEGFNNIKMDVGNIATTFARRLATQLDKDLVEAHKQIIDQYYSSYSPELYHRQLGLYDSLISHDKIRIGKARYMVSIVVGLDGMDNHYGSQFGHNDNTFQPAPENIFDLVWNKGVRGLPEKGDSGWINPCWNPQIYQNIFCPTLKIREFSQAATTADLAIEGFITNWDILGQKQCEKIEKYIHKTYS